MHCAEVFEFERLPMTRRAIFNHRQRDRSTDTDAPMTARNPADAASSARVALKRVRTDG